MLEEKLISKKKHEQNSEMTVSEMFSVPRNIATITWDSIVMFTSYGYSNLSLYCFRAALLLGEDAEFFLIVLDFAVVTSAISCLVLGFIGKENYNELQQLKKELTDLLAANPPPQGRIIDKKKEIQAKIDFISKLPITGLQLATPFIFVSAVVLGVTGVVLPDLQWSSLYSIPSLIIYAYRFGNEKMLLAAGKKIFVTLVSLLGLGLGGLTAYELSVNGPFGVDGIAIALLVENLFTFLVSMLGIRFMNAYQDIPFSRGFFSCGDPAIRGSIRPIAWSINLTYSSEWLCTTFRNYLAVKIGQGSAQTYVNQTFLLAFMVSTAVSEAVALGLKAIAKKVAEVLKISIEEAKTHPLTQKLQSRYAHSGLLTSTVINGALVIIVCAKRQILTSLLNPYVSSDIVAKGDSVIPYGAISSFLFGAAVTMRSTQASQVGSWSAKSYNVAIWLGAGYSAIAALAFDQDLKSINQAAMLGAILGLLTQIPGYLNTFCPSSRITAALNDIGNNVSNLWGSFKGKLWGGPTLNVNVTPSAN